MLTPLQIAFIVTASIVGVLIIGLFCYRPIKRRVYEKHYFKLYGKLIYQLANEFDYYLINNLVLPIDDGKFIHIDHVLFGNKFIYVIKDRFYRGSIEAKEEDKSWVFYKHDGVKKYIDNPIANNLTRLDKLSLIAGISQDFLISIVLVNDDCNIAPFLIENKNSFVVKKKNLRRCIKTCEERKVNDINEIQLKHAVQDIANLNERYKKNN